MKLLLLIAFLTVGFSSSALAQWHGGHGYGGWHGGGGGHEWHGGGWHGGGWHHGHGHWRDGVWIEEPFCPYPAMVAGLCYPEY